MRIVDRRLNPQGKNLGNRQRFIKRARSQVREAVKRNIRERSVTDNESGETVSIPADGIHEPQFEPDTQIGRRDRVFTGNREFREGDRIPRPEGGGGSGGQASEDGEGEDSFVFTLTRDEFLDMLFEDLELPDMVKQQLTAEDSPKLQRAGFATTGPPNRLNMVNTLRRSLVRRKALGRPNQAAIEQMERELERLKSGEIAPADGQPAEKRIAELEETLRRAKQKRGRVPYIDPMDLRFNRFERVPQPIAQAVMFCLMDVSASMDETKKDLAKRFFMLLHLFLERRYDKVDVVFIRHTNQACEVDEETFFHGRQTGGTIVSSALREMLRVVDERYPLDAWNVYVAQASDGDDVPADVPVCAQLLGERVLPVTQYMAYIEVGGGPEGRPGFQSGGASDLWKGYAQVAEIDERLQMRRVTDARDIYPVFRGLFSQEESAS